MDKLQVLLVLTQKHDEHKIAEIETVLSLKNVNCEISIFSNVEIKNKNVILLKGSKNEIENAAILTSKENILIIDLAYSLKTIKKVITNTIDNFNEVDIINFKNKENKFTSFFNKIKYFLYNFILSVFGLPGFLNINLDFQYLSEKVVNVIKNTPTSPNHMRLFNNFNGLETKTIELEKERVKTKSNFKFLILAFFLFALVIITVALTIFVAIQYNANVDITKVILVGLLLSLLFLVLSLCCFTYYNYIKRVREK